jgi:hypothetical protein
MSSPTRARLVADHSVGRGARLEVTIDVVQQREQRPLAARIARQPVGEERIAQHVERRRLELAQQGA